ncbi:MAG: glycosyltransferase family 4 protein [Patescibacteria group bacterium]
MRIIFITLKLDIVVGGGANRGLDIKLRSLQELGHDVRLITLFPELNRLPAEGVPYPIEEAPAKNRAFPALQQHVVELLKQNESRADIYHIDGATCLWAGGMYRMEGGRVPTVVYLPTYMEALNLLTPESPDITKGIVPWLHFHFIINLQWLKHWSWAKFVGLKYARRLDAIFADSPVLGENYARFGFPKNRIFVMPEFIDSSRFHIDTIHGGPIPTAFGAERPLHLLHAGRLLRMKGVDLLIRAVAGLRRSGRNTIVTVLGDGPQRERLERLVKELNVEDGVVFAPWKEEGDLAPAYAACDAFVHSCRFPEPFGRTILEALFFGRPIVTTIGSGSAWVAGDAGIATTMGSAEDLECGLANLYDHPEKLATMSAAAASRVSYFTHRTWTKNLADHLTSLVSPSTR